MGAAVAVIVRHDDHAVEAGVVSTILEPGMT
jgi:hypothetical protein